MSEMVFKWAKGSRLKINARAAGEELERIRTRNNGRLTPDKVVDAAKNRTSPLHAAFEWNDTEAARKFRLEQAGYIIRSIVVEVKRSKKKATPIRAFVNVRRDKDRSYTSISHAMSDKELRAQVIAKAWSELEDWRRRYANLSEFAKLFRVIDVSLPKKKAA